MKWVFSAFGRRYKAYDELDEPLLSEDFLKSYSKKLNNQNRKKLATLFREIDFKIMRVQ